MQPARAWQHTVYVCWVRGGTLMTCAAACWGPCPRQLLAARSLVTASHTPSDARMRRPPCGGSCTQPQNTDETSGQAVEDQAEHPAGRGQLQQRMHLLID